MSVLFYMGIEYITVNENEKRYLFSLDLTNGRKAFEVMLILLLVTQLMLKGVHSHVFFVVVLYILGDAKVHFESD